MAGSVDPAILLLRLSVHPLATFENDIFYQSPVLLSPFVHQRQNRH